MRNFGERRSKETSSQKRKGDETPGRSGSRSRAGAGISVLARRCGRAACDSVS